MTLDYTGYVPPPIAAHLRQTYPAPPALRLEKPQTPWHLLSPWRRTPCSAVLLPKGAQRRSRAPDRGFTIATNTGIAKSRY